MVGFDKELFKKNIKHLVRSSNKSYARIERDAGVTRNYVYMLAHKPTNPGLAQTLLVANELGVSIDTLLRADFTNYTEGDLYIINFVEKLLRDTISGKLAWYSHGKGFGKVGADVFGGKTYAEEEVYTCKLGLSVVKVRCIATKERDTVFRHKEIAMESEEIKEVVCSTNQDSDRIKEVIESLHLAIKKMVNRVKLPKNIIMAIDNYMKDED